MRLLLILILCAPALAAIDVKDLDGDTLRYARLALLKDAVRKHFDLKIGDYESLDQAVRLDVKMGEAKHMVVLRLKHKAACVLIVNTAQGDTAGAHCFLELENSAIAEPRLDAEFVAVRCAETAENTPQRLRLVRLKDGKLQACLTWLGSEEQSWNDGRYVRRTTRRLARANRELRLQTSVRYLLDNQLVDGGSCDSYVALTDTKDGLQRGATHGEAISVTTHCAIARMLERKGLNAAALHHANCASDQADTDKLPDDDSRRLEAMALVAKLEARLRRADVVER